MMIKYKTMDYGRPEIDQVDVVKETDSCVFIIIDGKERRVAKLSDYVSYHDTWDAAHTHLLGRAEAKLIGARRTLQYAQDAYGNVKGMKKPSQSEHDH